MGTTVTTNYGLIKPDTSESIKANLPSFAGWATQNGLNCDAIDAMFRQSNGTWTPTLTASVNPTLGTGGFVEGKYIRVMPRMVFCYFRIFFGTTGFAAGTGSYNLSVPFAIATELTTFANDLPVGKAFFTDSSAVLTSSAFAVSCVGTPDRVIMKTPSNDLWGAASPVAMGQSDRCNGYFMYPTSAA